MANMQGIISNIGNSTQKVIWWSNKNNQLEHRFTISSF
jgi:hypothetical protein